ncbi:Cyclodextrin-binding protein precursor [compost metagenome]
MKKAWMWSFIFILLISLTACAPNREGQMGEGSTGNNEGNEPGQQLSVGDSAKPAKLVVWSNDDSNQLKVVEQLAQGYTAETGIEVDVVPVSGSEQVQKLALAAPAGNGPDLFYQPQDRLGDLVIQGLAEPVELSGEESGQYSDAALQAVQYDGATYGFPISIETYAVYYNKALLEQVPDSLEEISNISSSLTHVSEDRYAFLMVPDFYYAIPFITNYGGYIFGESGGKYDASDLGLNNDGAVQGMTAFGQLVKDASIPATMTIDVMDTLFLEGKVGMVINGLWAMKTYEDKLGDQLGTAQIPAVNGKPAPSFVGVKSWFISSYSKHQDWAKDLALYFTNAANATVYYEQTGEIPAHPDAQQAITNELYAGFVAQIESGVSMPNIPEMSAVWEMDSAIDFIVKGDDPKAVLDETAEQISAQIAASGQ